MECAPDSDAPRDLVLHWPCRSAGYVLSVRVPRLPQGSNVSLQCGIGGDTDRVHSYNDLQSVYQNVSLYTIQLLLSSRARCIYPDPRNQTFALSRSVEGYSFKMVRGFSNPRLARETSCLTFCFILEWFIFKQVSHVFNLSAMLTS